MRYHFPIHWLKVLLVSWFLSSNFIGLNVSFQTNANRKHLWQNANPHIISTKVSDCESIKLLNAEAASRNSKTKWGFGEGQRFSPKWADFFSKPALVVWSQEHALCQCILRKEILSWSSLTVEDQDPPYTPCTNITGSIAPRRWIWCYLCMSHRSLLARSAL